VAHGRETKDGPDLVDYCITRSGDDFKVDAACTAASSLVRRYFAADDCGERKQVIFAPEENASQLAQVASQRKICKAALSKVDVSSCAGALHANGGRCLATVERSGDKPVQVCVRRDGDKVSIDLRCTETLDGPDGRRAIVKPAKRYDQAHPELIYQSIELTLPGAGDEQTAWIRKDDARPSIVKLRGITTPTRMLLKARPMRSRSTLDGSKYGEVVPNHWLVVDVVADGHWQDKPVDAVKKRCPDDMVYIPASTLVLGKDEAESNVRELGAYCLDRTEVTVAAYQACMAAKKCTGGGFMTYCNSEQPDRANHPMNCTDWTESKTFCESRGKRLPTEAEWEFAARGPDGLEFPWGNTKPDNQLCWGGVEPRRSSCPVGTFPAGNSPFEVSDMAGNVCEWTATSFIEGSNRYIYRGNGWYFTFTSGRDEHSTAYQSAPANGRNINLGFRCAASPIQ
jgi:hypothetical protein